MLVVREAHPVETSFVPLPGQEVYDTETAETFIGDGYKTVATLDAVASGGAAVTEIQIPAGSLIGATAQLYPQGYQTLRDSNNDFVTLACAASLIPEDWTTFSISLALFNDYTGQSGNMYMTTYALWDDDGSDTLGPTALVGPASGLGNVINLGTATNYRSNPFYTLLIQAGRNASHANDTLNADIYVAGMILNKVS